MRRGLCLLLALGALSAPPADAQTPDGMPTVRGFLFGDFLYTASSSDAPEAFKIGQTVAHGTAALSDRVLFFGELSITFKTSAYSLAMERAILRYDFSDGVKASVGRYHTPISYWNTRYHHGLWLQGSIARPEAIKFGSRFIPVHFVGAMAEGSVAGSPLRYQVGIGNGRSTNIASGGDGGDVNGRRAVIASAYVQPTALYGLRVGGALYLDRVPTADAVDADERITSAHVVWDHGGVELIAEYIDVNHEGRAAAVSTSSTAFFAHGGVRLGGRWRSVTPYARFETMSIAPGDVVFEGVLTDYDAWVAGLRYDFSSFSALKAEIRGEKRDGGARSNTFFVQASYAIPMFGG